MVGWRERLWREFVLLKEHKETFLGKLISVGREWDWQAYERLTQAMKECCKAYDSTASVETWLASGFWMVSTQPRRWVEWELYPTNPEVERYREACTDLEDLALWFYSGDPGVSRFGKEFEPRSPSAPGTIEYRLNALVEAAEVAELFRKAGMRRPFDDIDRIGAMLANANHTLTAWDGDKLVGIARSITDFVYCCYLSDLTVDPEYQGRGIGRELVWRTKQSVGEQVTLHLFSVPNAMEFYRHIGMENLTNGFRIVRSG
jgi:GNAT superfamily N-acetyltransferase